MKALSVNSKKFLKWFFCIAFGFLGLIILIFILVRMFPNQSLGVVEALSPPSQNVEITAWERSGATPFFQTEKSPLKPEFVLSLSDRASELMANPDTKLDQQHAKQLMTDVDLALTKNLLGYDEAFFLKSRAIDAAYEGKDRELERQKLVTWIQQKAAEVQKNPEPELVNIDGYEDKEKIKPLEPTPK